MSAAAPAPIYLGFDYGARRIGVAIGEALTGLARPLPAVANGTQVDWAAIDRLLADWQPAACIVGLPLDLDGNEQAMSEQARTFAQTLHERSRRPVHLCDERLSSRAALDELRGARADGRLERRVRRGDRDGVAARLILEQWLAGEAARTA